MRLRLLLSLFFLFSFSAIAQELPGLVTVREYTDFLNAVAVTDSHTLYHETMSEVTRLGEPDTYHYELSAEGETLPITFVTWFDEARYCNWKEHGSPAREEVTSETTETGSYTLNDDMSECVVKNEGTHYFLSMEEDIGFNDPTLSSNDRGFYILKVDGADRFNAASFLGASNPEEGDGTWSTFDEVIGVVGVLAVIGGGAGYAYHRCRAPHEQISIDRTVAGETAANRRAEEGVEAANRDRVEQEKKEEEDRARLDRFRKFQEDQENLREIGGYILKISELEPLCYSASAAPAVQHSSSSSASRVLEASLTSFQMLRQATQYLVITKLQAIEKAAKGSEHASEESVVAGQIQTQYHEVCKADAELMERLKILASKKELLWKYLAEMESDFVEHKQVEQKVSSIKEKMTGLEKSIQDYRKITQDRFNHVKISFDGDQTSNATREATDRDSVAQSFSSSNVEKKKKSKFLFGQFFSSSDNSGQSQAALAAAAQVDLSIETVCHELGERVEKKFTQEVHHHTDRVEEFFAQSYELLHLTERNILLGTELIRLYEADQGRKLWETSSLRPYLRETLGIARKAVSDVSDLFARERKALVGIWEKRESASTLNPIYYYQGEGWQTFTKEADITQGIEELKKLSNSIRETTPARLQENIYHAKTIAGLLDSAGTKAEELLSATTATLEARRRGFLEAMKTLLSNPILQPAQQATDQGQGGEEKKDGST